MTWPAFRARETGGRNRFARVVLLQVPRLNREDAIRVRVGKRRHENGVDDSEDRCVSADAERERQHGDDRGAPGDFRS